MLAAMLLISMGAFAQSNEPLEGDVNKDGKVDVADIVKVIDIMAAGEQPQTTKYTWYFGETDQEIFTVNDFNMTGVKPTTLNIGASSGNTVTIWIYPKSWGKPSQILDENGNDMTNAFIYGDDWMIVPSDYYGAWLQTQVAGTITLTWD
jgi:hypothetical protein